ncbi:MATE family efflux transporter [Aspergillus fijiensis CBS 313.89]|uniref:MATE efflux family protein n=1 Tax=Aspergillus fijiensis CBS 313.89 TaxID=1448319 RepID=A0A8G1VTM8_9EURO|nr:MATE efflux family protein [Aspergillus fijiensis CBS 313.89]RAK71251.1 MATE efflux family protein [Aspergillus fijiensis CBS 313.89]
MGKALGTGPVGGVIAASPCPQPDETSVLLPNPPTACPSHKQDGRYVLPTFLGEVFQLARDSIPVILAYALQNSLQATSILIVGRTSPEDLATAAFSFMFAAVTGWMIALGGTTALDTLASSTFTASANKHDLGVLLQRGFLVLGLFYLPVAGLWACAEPVFLLLGQQPQLSRDSARFLTCLIPGGLGYIYFELMKKYLQAQGLMRPGTYVLLITVPCNLCLNLFCSSTLRLGLLGAPIATGVSYWVSFGLLVLYTRYVAGAECWGGWSRLALRNLGTFARLALLGVVQVGTEWWAFEIVALAAGRLGTIPLAAQSVIMTADQILNTIPFGVGVAASARIGNLLGSRDAAGASRAANAAACLSMVLGGMVLVVLIGTRHDFAKIASSDARVVALTADVLPWVALFQIADGLNGSCGGSLRGMGRQHVGVLVNLVSYYGGALPLGIWLAFHGWGIQGLWVGQCVALYLVGALEWTIVALSDWDREVDKAFLRIDADKQGDCQAVAEGIAVDV